MSWHIAELRAVVGQNGVNLVRDGSDQGFEKGSGGPDVGRPVQLDEGELRGPVHRHEQMQLALLDANLGEVDMKVADRVGLEWLAGLSPPTSGSRLIPWRCRQRCKEERVRCGIVACRA